MNELNTTFKQESNSMCNNVLFSSGRICNMHEQTERLYQAAKVLKNVTGQSAVARLLNASPQTVKNWESRGVSKEGMIAAQEAIGCSSTWLNTGLGEMVVDRTDQQPQVDQNTPSDDDYALIPQYTAKGGCGPAYHNGHVEVRGGLAFKRDWLSRMGTKPENLSVIYAKGDSMAPTIEDGAVILIDHSQAELRDGRVYALARGDEVIVKRMVRDFAGGWIVRSDNPDKVRYGDFQVSDATVRIVGRVVWRGGSGGL